jgi:hypothetical protein
MLINRENYEMYFLLYVDDELSTAERKALLLFLQDNPDLKNELHQWQQTKLVASTEISFEAKELLYRHEGEDAIITEDNFEEYGLLYVDGELSDPNKRALEHFAAGNASRQNSLSILLQTKSIADPALIFENKDLLYRREKTRIIPFAILRLAAACLLLLFAGWFISRIYSRKEYPHAPLISNTGTSPKNDMAEKKDDTKVTSAMAESLYLKGIQQKAKMITGKNEIKKSNPAKLDPHENAKQGSQNQDIAVQKIVPADTMTEQRNESTMLATSVGKPVTISRHDAVSPDNSMLAAKPLDLEENATNQETDLINREPAQEEGLNLMAFAEKKNRMRGIFRKVSRVLDKTTNGNDDNKKQGVLIGSFQIALK